MICRDIRNHNSRELTVIRKVLGDLGALRESIVREFNVDAKHVVVKVQHACPLQTHRCNDESMQIQRLRTWSLTRPCRVCVCVCACVRAPYSAGWESRGERPAQSRDI